MKTRTLLSFCAALTPLALAAAQPALTIYNQNFAAVRERIPLELDKGVTSVSFDHATLQVEPDSVVLRDPTGKVRLSILEQSYRAETASAGLMLSLFEGKELEFLTRDRDGKEYTVRGKVIRSGHTPGGPIPLTNRSGQRSPQPGNNAPIIEVDGKLRFSLPGEPLFPALADDTVLRPTLSWKIAADRKATLDAELGYLTGGFSWQAAYNLVAPETGDTMDIVGWVTLENRSGKTFTDAQVKLMAGDVSKLEPGAPPAPAAMEMRMAADMAMPQVTEKAFDEFHLYSLPLPVTLRHGETKQVEFLRATDVKATTLYIYNGAAIDQRRFRGWNDESIRQNPEYGTQSNPKVWVFREFENTKANGLGLPLPKGRTRFYREDDADDRIEFTGENTIDHTPEGETVRIYTGDAFDIVGERKRTEYTLGNRNDSMEEAFEIKLRNRKKVPVEVRVTERLYRWVNWEVVFKDHGFVKTDDRNIEFVVTLQPDEEKVINYRVRYNWR